MSSVFEVADRFVDEPCEMRPIPQTFIGVKGHHDEWGDTGLTGVEAQRDFGLHYRGLFAGRVDGADFLDRLAAQAIAYKLGKREILSIRGVAQQRLGADFDPKSFYPSVPVHRTMRPDLLREISEELLDGASALA